MSGFHPCESGRECLALQESAHAQGAAESAEELRKLRGLVAHIVNALNAGDWVDARRHYLPLDCLDCRKAAEIALEMGRVRHTMKPGTPR